MKFLIKGNPKKIEDLRLKNPDNLHIDVTSEAEYQLYYNINSIDDFKPLLKDLELTEIPITFPDDLIGIIVLY
jgi:hypothetical protein